MSKPIRVLHVLGRLNMGGAESRIMDLYRHIDREQVQFDFLLHYRLQDQDKDKGTDTDTLYKLRSKEDFDDEVLLLGGCIYVLPRFTGLNLPMYQKACRIFFESHHDFAIIEGHMTSMASVYLPIAKKAGVPVTIAHARSAGVDSGIRGIATRLFRLSLPYRCDIMMSCSGPASEAVFGKRAAERGKILLVPNALDLSAFHFDEKEREKARDRYGIGDKTLVIGHVGRFDPVKNQAFLLDVAKALQSKGDLPFFDFKFLFVGKGDQQQKVKRCFEESGLTNNAVFAGQLSRDETAAAYQAFDLFALPSLYEGLPGTVIEAQAAGLPCLISDAITKEVAITPFVFQLSLQDPSLWAQCISDTAQQFPSLSRKERSGRACEMLGDAGYEITAAARKMQAFYLNAAR